MAVAADNAGVIFLHAQPAAADASLHHQNAREQPAMPLRLFVEGKR
ncbi:MAG TPA: hypothetical protein VGO49_22470 [Bradyrhizobium sp.]|nr:hypothetical protein [Bradyrhizobium sp.]